MDPERERKWIQWLKQVCQTVNEKFAQVSNLEEVIHEKFKKSSRIRPVVTLILAILFFVAVAFFHGFVHVWVDEWYHQHFGHAEPQLEVDLIMPTTIHHQLISRDGYVTIWEPVTTCRAPDKGWLVLENPYYRLKINLDHSYYLMYDKLRERDILVYNDTVKNKLDMLTGCDLGFGDHDGDNPIQYASTALYDPDGISYEILYEDSERGFVLIDTLGWDTTQTEAAKGYDVEAEVAFGLFADQPYFINAVELSNLQRMGCAYQVPYKDPDEIVQSWVLVDEYRTTCMKGGDNTHGDLWGPPLLYNVTSISRTERKPWHVGSAAFSKMFPEHILLGDKMAGGVIFSIPEGVFRFDEGLGVYGDQIVGEFIINVDEPQKAIAFTVNPVNELLFFYDLREFTTVDGYPALMEETCNRYGLVYPNGTLDAHNWRTKRYAYVITLVDGWYDAAAQEVTGEAWALADQGIADFSYYQARIGAELERTRPLTCL
jgi:hypothetical protein